MPFRHCDTSLKDPLPAETEVTEAMRFRGRLSNFPNPMPACVLLPASTSIAEYQTTARPIECSTTLMRRPHPFESGVEPPF